MSLLDGLNDALANPLLDAVTESDIDDALDFDFVLEAAVEPKIALSEEDVEAILNDENPDNVVADLSGDEETIDGIARMPEDEIDEAIAAIESIIKEKNNKYEDPSAVKPEELAKVNEECEDPNCDEGDGCSIDVALEDEDIDEGDDDDGPAVDLESLVDTIFNM